MRAALFVAVAALFAAPLAAQVSTTTQFGVTVPVRSAPLLPLSRLKITVTLTTDAPVAFNVTDPGGLVRRFPAAGNVSPGGATVEHEFCGTPCSPPAGAAGVDVVTMFPPSASLAAGDPARKRYVFFVETNSDYNFTSACVNTMAGNETWNIALVSPPATLRIAGTCIESFDLGTPGFVCAQERRTPLGLVAFLSGSGQPDSFCGDERPALDVTLVLDRSGSMAWSTLGGAPRPKIAALRSAVDDFVSTWSTMRSAETGAAKDDRIGVVFFNHGAAWQSAVGVPAWSASATGPQPFATFAPLMTPANVSAVAASGATSIGDGLFQAANGFPAGDRRRVVLLMSDGMQNSGRMVAVNDPTTPTQVLTHPVSSPATLTPLPNQSTFAIYSVTVGTSTAVSADINEDVARATGGFYINSEDNAELLRPFFLELLQNFLRFNTYETVRLMPAVVASGRPFQVPFFITSTTDRILASVTTSNQQHLLRITLTPPGGGAPIVMTGRGRIQALAEMRRLGPAPGPWTLRVALDDSIARAPASVPIEVVVLADDPILRTDLSIAGRDYAPGDRIVLRARLTEGGRPLTSLGSGGRVTARVARPGQSLGEILSATSTDAAGMEGDPASAADAQLATLLQENPGALQRPENEIELFDNGDAANGDEQAGDGIYSAAFAAPEPGHYHFVISAQGATRRIGQFTREQARTAHVRSVPAPAQTTITTTTTQGPAGPVLDVVMVPRNASGSRMGPGWANYFWFTGGAAPVKAEYRGEGAYGVSIPYSGATPPVVQVHFLRTSTQIGDAVTADQLPVRLGGGTMIIPDASRHRRTGGGGGGGCGSLPGPFGIIGLAALGLFVGTRRRV